VENITNHCIVNPFSVNEENGGAAQTNTNNQESKVAALGKTPEHTERASYDQPNPYDARNDVLYRRYLGFTIVGVIGGLIGLGFLIWQTVLVKRSTAIAQLAARAALANAESVINAERAWIMVDVMFIEGGLVKITNILGDSTAAKVRILLTNCGSSPAWIFEQYVILEVLPHVIASGEQYPSPNFPNVGEGKLMKANYQIIPIIKGQSPEYWDGFLTSPGWPSENDWRFAYIYGVIRYRDPFSTLRETFFGYSVRNGSLERIPNEAYNKHT